MPTFAGVNHVALTVTDLDVSEHFYTEVLEFRRALDVGYGRILIHSATGCTIALLTHPDAAGGAFTELRSRDVSDEEVRETAQRLLGDDFPTL